MTDFLKIAEMTKKVTGIAKLKGAPEVHARPLRKITHVAEFLDEEDVVCRILLELMSTPEERARGMMGRDSLPPICGMLFKGLSGGGSFWMKNCLIPLDVVFMSKGGYITKTYSMPVDKTGGKRYSYDDDDVSAIEVPMGFCKQHGIVPGYRVEVARLSSGKGASNG